MIEISGANFLNNLELRCLIGATFVQASVYSEFQASCDIPRDVNGPRLVTVYAGRNPLYSLTLDFFMNTVQVESKTAPARNLVIGSFLPHSGLVFGGTAIEVSADGIDLSDLYLCDFNNGQHTSPAMVTKLNHATCFTPAAGSEGQIPFRIKRSSDNATWAGGFFNYVSPMKIRTIFPRVLQRTSNVPLVLDVSGLDTTFLSSSELNCRIGAEVSAALIVARGSVSCAYPPLVTDFVDVSIGSSTENWSNVVTVSVMERRALKAEPYFGSIYGGTDVSLQFSSPIALNYPWCMFGSSAASNSTLLDPYTLLCTSPSLSSTNTGFVYIAVTDVSDKTSEQSYGYALFKYTYPADLAATIPEVLYQNATTNLLVRVHSFSLFDFHERIYFSY